MARKETSDPKEVLGFPNRRLILASTILAIITILGFAFFYRLQVPYQFSLNAIIIDQLEEHLSNPQFKDNITDLLETAGFDVTYNGSDELNVNFFKGLAKINCGIIILRVHSALREDGSTVDLFTSEKFKTQSHTDDQENGLLVKGIINDSQTTKEYFAITSKFIESLEGTFPKSVVIAMGCWSLKPECTQMAEAFIKKGAKAYFGWKGLVQASHTDNETIDLLRRLINENKTLLEAVDDVKPDPLFGKTMDYYPSESGNLTISSLITEVDTTSDRQSVLGSSELVSSWIYIIPRKTKKVSYPNNVKLTR